jgi:hypothetical protein
LETYFVSLSLLRAEKKKGKPGRLSFLREPPESKKRTKIFPTGTLGLELADKEQWNVSAVRVDQRKSRFFILSLCFFLHG